ncbi:MAG TPA: carboxypeptidase regulatory-like domain-containing protein, partial [Longimicrobiaceae bacterium]|nr:carboxypeptidase regulatory-like domain-containing protein [Longimicrobiaceae bacterium]
MTAGLRSERFRPGSGPAPTAGSRRVGRALPWRWLTMVAACLLVAGPAAAQGTATVRGQVRTDSTRLPVAGATVELQYPGWSGGVVTDEAGGYVFRQVPAGRGVLRVRHLAHEPLEVEVIVSAGREVVLDAVLAIRPVALEAVTVEAEPSPALSDTLPGRSPALARVGARVIETAPGLAELGITEAVRGIPGAEPPDPGSVLYVRGAAADLKLVYLDGAPVYAPFPLGGLVDPFAPGMLQQADIYLGGAPARYDGGLSYVMDLRTRAAQEQGIRTTGSADLLSARLMAEAGRDGLGLIASVRGVHPFGAAAFLRDELPYEYGEGLVRADARIGRVGTLSVTGFSNREAVDVGEIFPGGGQIRWANRSGSTRFRGAFGATAAEVTLAVGDYSARLPLVSTQSLVAEGATRRARLSLDLARRFDAVQLRYGLSLDEQEHEARATPVGGAAPSASIEAAGRVAGIYGEVGAQPLPRLRLHGGARIDHFSTAGETVVAPRMAATWLVTDRAALTLAAGRYHQFLRPPDEVLLQSGGSAPIPLAAAMVVGSSSHFTVSLD